LPPLKVFSISIAISAVLALATLYDARKIVFLIVFCHPSWPRKEQY